MSDIIRLENLTKCYRTGETEVWALRGINLAIKDGEFLSIMGPSGSGKTTLLNMIGALDKPTSGRVLLSGIELSTLSEKERCMLRLRKIGFVFQLHNLLPTLTALENVEFPMMLAGIPKARRKERAIELLSFLGLSSRISHRPSQLSAGEAQRVAIARALANNPPILLADEPTGNVDSETASVIMDYFNKVNRELKKTIIVVTHDPDVAKRAERIVKLRDGRLQP